MRRFTSVVRALATPRAVAVIGRPVTIVRIARNQFAHLRIRETHDGKYFITHAKNSAWIDREIVFMRANGDTYHTHEQGVDHFAHLVHVLRYEERELGIV